MTSLQRALIVLFATICVVPCMSQQRDAFAIVDGKVIAQVEGVSRTVGYLAVNDDPFYGFNETFEVSPDGSSIAFIGEDKGWYGLYLFRPGMRTAGLLPGDGEVTGRTRPVWSADSSHIAYSIGNRIWVYDVSAMDGWMVTEPEQSYYEDIDPEFSDDGTSIFFYRGTTFEYVFSGERYRMGIDGEGLSWVEESYPKYPPEDLGGSEIDDPYIATSNLLMEMRVESFVEDLENHDFERLFNYFPGWYVVTQLDTMGDLGTPVSRDVFDRFFFGGAVMYTDYSNTVSYLDSIQRVLSYDIAIFDLEVHFRVELADGREVEFFLMFDQDTLLFSGAFG